MIDEDHDVEIVSELNEDHDVEIVSEENEENGENDDLDEILAAHAQIEETLQLPTLSPLSLTPEQLFNIQALQ